MATRTEMALPEARVGAVEHTGDGLRIRLDEFFLYVALTGSEQQTKWRHAGSLIFEQAEIGAAVAAGGRLAGGDIQDNATTYRDRIPLPLDSRGQVGCILRFEDGGEPIEIRATRIRLETTGERRYVGHVN